MIIKRYLVKNINEAMTRIRYELGKDAIIISQRKVRKPGIKGLFSGKFIEVTAAVENSEEDSKEIDTKNSEKKVVNQEDEFRKSLESIKRLMENELAVSREEKSSPLNNMIAEHNSNVIKERENNHNTNKEADIINEIRNNNAAEYKTQDDLSVESVHNEVVELKNLLSKVMENKSDANNDINFSEKIKNVDSNDSKKLSLENQLKEKLYELDIDEGFYEEIIRMAKDYSKEELNIEEILRDIFEREILVTTGTFKGKVALVGPTGVGKTTTIAKLAGRLALVENKKVGLITIDTYRIGAIEQLKTYAEIMNIPFKVVITIKEMQEAIEEMKDCDVVLIDTTGRSSKNTMQISELRAFIQNAKPDCVNMVISATTKNRDIESILKGYSELKYNNIIVTKLDETTVYGSIYNISRIANKPINYITVGQNVPDDIRKSSKEELASFILGEEALC